MRYYRLLCAVIALAVCLCSCVALHTADKLEYQKNRLYLEAIFSLDGEAVPVKMTLEAPEYDESGRMLARDATFTVGENSIISGVSFEFSGGDVYVTSGALKIPINDETVVSGVCDIISLFCISGEHYHSSEKLRDKEVKSERVLYVNGNNRVEVTLDLTCMLPSEIVAEINGRTISADISYIKAE